MEKLLGWVVALGFIGLQLWMLWHLLAESLCEWLAARRAARNQARAPEDNTEEFWDPVSKDGGWSR